MDCPICNRTTPPEFQEKHHLIPRTRRKAKKKPITIDVCCSCGDMIHKLFTNKELAKKYNTLESILGNDDIQKWISWVAKKPNDFSISMAAKKKKR